MKSEVRRLKGIPALVSLLDQPSKEVHHSACGALKNISYGRDPENKIAIKNCDGVPALVRLLRKTHDQDLTDIITGTPACRISVHVMPWPFYLFSVSTETFVQIVAGQKGKTNSRQHRRENHKLSVM